MVIIGRSSEDNGGWGGVFAIQIDRLGDAARLLECVRHAPAFSSGLARVDFS
jgi:hypothetical protein